MITDELLKLLLENSNLKHSLNNYYYYLFSKDKILEKINDNEIKIAKLYTKRNEHHKAIYYWKNIYKNKFTSYQCKIKIKIKLALYNDEYKELFEYFKKTNYIIILIKYYYSKFKLDKTIKLSENYLSYQNFYNVELYDILANCYLFKNNKVKALEYYEKLIFEEKLTYLNFKKSVPTYLSLNNPTNHQEILNKIEIKYPNFLNNFKEYLDI